MIKGRETTAAAAARNTSRADAGPDRLGPTRFELRKYKTRRGAADRLISMFEAHFLDAYQAAGAVILGTFRCIDDADSWVWIRAFADNRARARALNGFYGSDVWKELRGPANATIANSKDALLLRSVAGDIAGLCAPPCGEPAPASVFECVRHFPKGEKEGEHLLGFVAGMAAEAPTLGGQLVTMLVSAQEKNLFPRSPLRSEAAIVSIVRFDDAQAYAAGLSARAGSRQWRAWEADCQGLVCIPIDRFPLLPTPRSALR